MQPWKGSSKAGGGDLSARVWEAKTWTRGRHPGPVPTAKTPGVARWKGSTGGAGELTWTAKNASVEPKPLLTFTVTTKVPAVAKTWLRVKVLPETATGCTPVPSPKLTMTVAPR